MRGSFFSFKRTHGFDRRLLATLLLGFASGLPLALSGATLQAWLATQGVSFKSLGLFALAGIPYTWKFLWAPWMDRYAPPLLGRRRGWMVLLQWALALVLLRMAWHAEPLDLPLLALCAIALAFLSASQDVVIDAWRTEVLAPAQRGLGAALGVLGYRLGMLVSGALALICAQAFGWSVVYAGMGVLFLLLPLLVWWAPEPPGSAAAPASLQEAVIGPWQDFMRRDGAWAMLLLVIGYKLSDAFAAALSTAFLLRGPGFTLAEVGMVNKGVGLVATLVGAVIGGAGLARLGLLRALLLFGALQALAALGFAALAVHGHALSWMIAAVTLENLTSGMGTSAFAALLMSLCTSRYSATQFALLSALSAIGRVYVGPAAGYLVDALGWPLFFVFSTVSGVPGLWLVWWQRARIASDERSRGSAVELPLNEESAS